MTRKAAVSDAPSVAEVCGDIINEFVMTQGEIVERCETLGLFNLWNKLQGFKGTSNPHFLTPGPENRIIQKFYTKYKNLRTHNVVKRCSHPTPPEECQVAAVK